MPKVLNNPLKLFTRTLNMAPSKNELIKLANKLLAKHGFSYDGQSRNSVAREQKYFEKKKIIGTPMGNGCR
ncbi:MAG: hypothetical protein NTX66_02180 [Candidatus Falkowbacteria bacterium]|nr:hypothetical protein [Candidatus Falkowbacteria bacterium]